MIRTKFNTKVMTTKESEKMLTSLRSDMIREISAMNSPLKEILPSWDTERLLNNTHPQYFKDYEFRYNQYKKQLKKETEGAR